MLKLLQERVYQLERQVKYDRETGVLRTQIQREQQAEVILFTKIQELVLTTQKCFCIEFDIENEGSMVHVKHVLESKSAAVCYRNLRPEERPLFDEAKARELSEVVSSQSLRAVLNNAETREASYENVNWHLPMRWVLTWKPLSPPEPTKPGEPTTSTKDGAKKAKARIVIIGDPTQLLEVFGASLSAAYGPCQR